MKTKVITTIMLTLFLASIIAIVIPVKAGTEWHVYWPGPIQAAVDAASSGDTIIVHTGTYTEAVVIDKSLTLQGEDRETTEIKFGYAVYPSISPLTISAANVKVSGFTIRSGPYIEPAWTIAVGGHSALLTDLDVIKEECRAYFGGPFIKKGAAVGFVIPNILSFTFTDSTVESKWNGVYTREGSSNIVVRTVEFTYPGEFGIYLKGITGATIKGNGFTCTADYYGVIVTLGSDDIVIMDNQFTGTGVPPGIGILLQKYYTGLIGDVEIMRNEISTFKTGIEVQDVGTTGISIHHNTIIDNAEDGIKVSGDNCEIAHNTVNTNVGFDIHLMSTADYNIVHHNVMDESVEVEAGATGNKVFKNTPPP